jgi:hypothetical protein
MPTSAAGRRSVAVAIAVLAGVAACYRGRPTPGPSAGFERVDSLRPTDAALGTYIARLRFDSSYGDADEQRLMVGKYPDARYGPLVRIEAESGAFLLSRDDLARGRIIARLINRSDDPYAKLGLAPHSVTYWWVELPAGSLSGRSVFISADSASGRIVSRTVGRLVYEEHKARQYHGPSARWIWDPADEQGWIACGGGCCKSLM